MIENEISELRREINRLKLEVEELKKFKAQLTFPLMVVDPRVRTKIKAIVEE